VKHIIGSNHTPAKADESAASGPVAQRRTVEEDGADQRLDNYLIRHLKGVPKTHIYRIIRSGEVRVNKGRANADTRLQLGDVVRLPPVRVSERATEKAQTMADQAARFVPAKDFPVLFEDDYFLAVNKPAGVAVHGGSGVSFGVIEQLRMARPQAKFLELVHRIDRETSGILLIAKKRSALKNLQDQFRDRSTGKTYLAVVLGFWPENKKVLDKPLHKFLTDSAEGLGERRVKVVAKDDPNGMPSLSLVKVLARSPESERFPYSLLEVTIKTGRTHQIRVHLSSEGLPIAGDDKYGDFERNKNLAKADHTAVLKRMFLHAWRIQFKHPATQQDQEIRAELAPDLQVFLRAIHMPLEF
jgi:23S rRNA pseudouridine955/2504/2580 synthase